MAGRKPLPTRLKVLKGMAQPCRTNPQEPRPEVVALDPPEYLGTTARAEWQRKTAKH